MRTFTHLEIQEIQNQEKALLQKLQKQTEKSEEMPRKEVVDAILAYSKAVSIRKSTEIGFIENVLN